MMPRFSPATFVAALAAVLWLAPFVFGGDPAPDKAQFPDAMKWDLARLSKEPLKLIKTTPDAPKGQVRIVVEFTRAPLPSELFTWEQAGSPVVFRFLDEDGIVLSKVVPRLEGELIPKKGARLRLLLVMPDEKTMGLIRSVKAE